MTGNWKHLITLTAPENLKRTLQNRERFGWQLCAIVQHESGILQLVTKRKCLIDTECAQNDQAFLELVEHHQSHHAADHERECAELDPVMLQRLLKEKAHAKCGSAVWQSLCYVLQDYDDPRRH